MITAQELTDASNDIASDLIQVLLASGYTDRGVLGAAISKFLGDVVDASEEAFVIAIKHLSSSRPELFSEDA